MNHPISASASTTLHHAATDPDRWVNPSAPGAHEWWYFDAISHDGRDALVIVWYAALPFDPDYGLASLRHISQPTIHPRPEPLDHCAIGLSWYRDGKTIAYALNRFRKQNFQFANANQSLSIHVDDNNLSRNASNTYNLQLNTPALGFGKKRIQANLQFTPAPQTKPWEQDLGSPEHPHLWILAAPDCQVEGEISLGKTSLNFRGRGYHDHNAGHDELSRSFYRWHWGRFHHNDQTSVYYLCEHQPGQSDGLWINCQNGSVSSVEQLHTLNTTSPKRTVFGINFHGQQSHPVHNTSWQLARPVDQGPFYLRWVSQFQTGSGITGLGFSELLHAKKLHQPWFNWMIPYRLKQPKPTRTFS